MSRPQKTAGFTLIELLLALAIIGIISAIAIPTFMGQRRRARVIGDAKSNAMALQMAIQIAMSEATLLPAGKSQSWTASGAYPAASVSWAPRFTPKGNSQMNYTVAIGPTGLTYLVTVTDPTMKGAQVLTVDDQGKVTLDAVYNK